jgi:hypothetical protein
VIASFWKLAGTGLLLALLALPASAAKPRPGEGVRARLAPVVNLAGEFDQEKQVQGFRNSLKSSGSFLLAGKRGVVWVTKKPFASTLVLTSKQLTTLQPDGTRQALPGTAGRAATVANSLMLALVTGDVGALEKRFTLAETLNADGTWTLALTPREPALRKAIARVDMSGARYVTHVAIQDAGGDRTLLTFSGLRELPTLTATEAAQFE